MKNSVWLYCIILTAIMTPCLVFSGTGDPHAPHWKTISSAWNADYACIECHEGWDGGGWLASAPECSRCHYMPNHLTSTYLGSGDCLECHEPHYHNPGNTGLLNVDARFLYKDGDDTTLEIDPDSIRWFNYGFDWADPITWNAGNELILVKPYLPEETYKIIGATENTITVRDAINDGFPTIFTQMTIKYGKFISDWINGNVPSFKGPHTMDEVCGSCHSWTHFDGGTRIIDGEYRNYTWKCTICHPHKNGFRYYPPPEKVVGPSGEMTIVLDQWNVDIQGDGGSTLYGQEGTAHPHGPDANGVWNVMNLPPLDADPATTVMNPSLNLVNHYGVPGSVTFSLIGDAGGWSGIPGQHSLIGDYLILLANNYFGYPSSLGLDISGLEEGATYKLIVRSGENGTRNMQTSIDLNGDGLLTDETPVTTLGGGTTSSFRFTANASGILVGEIAIATTNEANFAGFHLQKIEIKTTLPAGWDCEGTWDGDAVLDNCGICDNDPGNDCVRDCTGAWDGDAVLDNCGTCDSDPNNDCTLDCNGIWGGDAVLDNCGTCDNNPGNDCVQDCQGVWDGTAVLNECGICSGGTTGVGPCTLVIDTLMWQQADDNTRRYYNSAAAYCDGLTFAGYDDWRLPTITELESIVDTSNTPTIVSGLSAWPNPYWSSTTASVSAGVTYKYGVYFGTGSTNSYKTNIGVPWVQYGIECNVRCVRDN